MIKINNFLTYHIDVIPFRNVSILMRERERERGGGQETGIKKRKVRTGPQDD